MELSRDDLAKHLMDDLLTLYKLIVDEVYKPAQFHTILMRDGAVECSRYLLGSQALSYGFEKLYTAERLELTVENFILRTPIYHVFFTEPMMNTAKRKMEDLRFDVSGDRLESFVLKHPKYRFHHLGKG